MPRPARSSGSIGVRSPLPESHSPCDRSSARERTDGLGRTPRASSGFHVGGTTPGVQAGRVSREVDRPRIGPSRLGRAVIPRVQAISAPPGSAATGPSICSAGAGREVRSALAPCCLPVDFTRTYAPETYLSRGSWTAPALTAWAAEALTVLGLALFLLLPLLLLLFPLLLHLPLLSPLRAKLGCQSVDRGPGLTDIAVQLLQDR